MAAIKEASLANRHNWDEHTQSRYLEAMPTIDPGTIELLKSYAGIPAEEVDQHLRRIRDEAWEIHPYPCIGHWRIFDLSISKAPQYSEVLQRVKVGERLLDLGCCVGQDARRLVFDGAPADNVMGIDKNPEFFDVGYDLFRDKGKLSTKFKGGNIFLAVDSEENQLKEHKHSFDIIHASSFYHLFSFEHQLLALQNSIALLKDQPGVMIFGRQTGRVEAGPIEARTKADYEIFFHNEKSWCDLWRRVEAVTGTKWSVHVERYFDGGWHMTGRGEGMRFKYCARREE